MKREHLTLVVIGIVLTLVIGPIGAEEETAARKWRKVQDSGVVIEFKDETELLALEVLPEAVKRLKEIQLGEADELDKLIRNKDAVLQFIGHQLALDQPGRSMTQAFGKVARGLQQLLRVMPDPHHITIWQREKLKKLLIAGENIPSFTYNPDSDKVEYMLVEEQEFKENTLAPRRPFPIVIKDDLTKKPIQQAIEQMDKFVDMLKHFPSGLAGTLCHEVTEVGIVWDIGVRSPFRRWFSDGVANYVVGLCLEEFLGKAASQTFLDAFDVSRYQHLKDQIDLLSWQAGEWERESPYPIDTETSFAYYAFSTHEILGLADRHGPDIIPAIFKQIAKFEVQNEQTVFDAIKKVTNEDFRAVLKKYGTMATDDFKGLAIRHFVVGPCEKDDKGKWHMTKETTTIPIIAGGKHGICLHFHYATTNPPVALKVEFVGPPKPDGPGDVMTQTAQLTKKSDVVQLYWWPTADEKPGECQIRTYFDNELYRNVEITLVQEPTQRTKVSPSRTPHQQH